MTSTFPQTHVDVLIIGAGPAGYMLATSLLHQGIKNVMIVDQRQEGVKAGQADGIQPRTIEIMHSYGLGDRLMAEANRMSMAAMYNPDPQTGGITCTERLPDVHAPGARWPFELTLHQGGIEAIFRDDVVKQGLQIDYGYKPVNMIFDEAKAHDTEAHVVRVDLADASKGEEPVRQIHARYVVGCDGAHSWTRRWLGFAMQGEQTEYVWGVMDGHPDTEFPDWRCKCAVHSLQGSCMVLPRENNLLRLYVQMAVQDVSAGGRINRAQFTPEDIKKTAAAILAPYKIEFANVDWWTVYVIGQRVASAYSHHQRIFIAGDACHTHSPKAGQGANAAMGDAHNLAWKLAVAIKGLASDAAELLATYEIERRRFAQDLIAFDRIFAALFSGKAESTNDDAAGQGVSHDEFVAAFRAFGIFTSGIGIDYSSSPVDRIVAELRMGKLSKKLDIADIASEQPLTQTPVENVLLRPVKPTSGHPDTSVHVGRRMPPTVLVRAADGWSWHLHDIMPTTGAFRLLLWLGDVTLGTSGAARVIKRIGDQVSLLLHAFTPKGQAWDSVIDVISIATTPYETQFGWSLPQSLRLFGARNGWEKIFSDRPALSRIADHVQSGNAYTDLGIDRDAGAAIVVRPDGYVAVLTDLDQISSQVHHYFATVLRKQ